VKKKKSILTKKILKELNCNGYCIINNFLDVKSCINFKNKLEKLSLKLKKNKKFEDERSKKGQVIVRDIVLRSPDNFLPLIDKKLIMDVLGNLFHDKFILDNCMASNSVNVNNNHSSLVHIDSHLPSKKIEFTSDIVVMYCFDEFSKKNGATKVWPKSHLSGVRIQDDKNYKEKIKRKYKYVEANKGSIVFFLGQTWHQIGKNFTNKSRWGLLCHYKRWWIKPSTDFTKCGKKIFKKLNSKQKELFGFTSISPSFNFKSKTRNLKTLRNINNLDSEYYNVISY